MNIRQEGDSGSSHQMSVSEKGQAPPDGSDGVEQDSRTNRGEPTSSNLDSFETLASSPSFNSFQIKKPNNEKGLVREPQREDGTDTNEQQGGRESDDEQVPNPPSPGKSLVLLP